MSIGKKFSASLQRVQILNRKVQLGYHPSILIKYEGENGKGELLRDNLGEYFWLVLKQVDTGLCTAPGEGDEIDYRNVVKVHKGESGYNKAGYAQREGWGYVKFFEAIEEQHPELKKLGDWEEEITQLQKNPIGVWYTRNSGYLAAHFSEQAYQYAVANGAEGADPDELTPDETKVLNEDVPF